MVQHDKPCSWFHHFHLYPHATQMPLHRSSLLFSSTLWGIFSFCYTHSYCDSSFRYHQLCFLSLAVSLTTSFVITILCMCSSHQVIALSLHVVGILILLTAFAMRLFNCFPFRVLPLSVHVVMSCGVLVYVVFHF